jgi:hypothetical protein
MKFESTVFRSMLSVVVLAGTFAAQVSAAQDQRKEIDAEIDARQKANASYRDIVEFLEGRVASDDARTNAALRVHIDRKILSFCATPGWTRLGRWDKEWSDGRVPAVCEREISAADCPPGEKIEFLRALARLQAGARDYAASLATAEKATALEGLKPGDLFKAHCLVADAFRWADRYEDAKAAYRRAAAFSSGEAAKALANLAVDWCNDADIVAAWKGLDDPYPRLSWYCASGRAEESADDAFAYVSDANNPAPRRREILIRYFGADKSERGDRAREIARGLDYAGFVDGKVVGEFSNVYRFGDWALFAKIAEAFPTLPWFQDPGRYRGYLFSLVATGRGGEVAKKADEFLAKDAASQKPSVKPFDRVRFEMLKALAEGKDLIPVAKAANLDIKEYAQALQIAAQWTLNLQRNEECERYSAAYRALFKEAPERRYAVKYFDSPVSSIAAWRGVADSLEKSYVDVKMCGELDSLETDVATGRTEIEKTALDSKDARMEVSSFCDVEGLKIVMRVADANARAVENGFAGGIGTECYFAPGAGEPYICFSSSPKEGIGFVFYTAYSSAYAQRVEYDDARSPFSLRQETAFTDGDYVLMVTLPWSAFYQKLPAASGTEWRFECLADGHSWGGSQGVHESSSWGRLVFDLKPDELAAIRRRLVYDTCKAWSRSGHGALSAFDRWGDPVVGDPEFYEECLKPLEAELKAQAAKVKPDMSDDEVNEVYEKGAKVWIGLDHEIDALRREWLLGKLTGK